MNLISVQSSEILDIGNYTLAFTAKLNDVISFTTFFTISIQNVCTPTIVYLPSMTLFYTYRVSSPSLNIPILPFTLDESCSSISLVYGGFLQSGPSVGSSFITFSTETRAI